MNSILNLAEIITKPTSMHEINFFGVFHTYENYNIIVNCEFATAPL